MARSALAYSALTLFLIAGTALPAEEAIQDAKDTKQTKAASTQKSKNNTFKMGEVTVVVTGKLDPVETAHTKVDAEQIQMFGRDTAAAALDLLPGVSVGLTGGRNEAQVFVRGNNARQVPVFVDGIPAYVPYDGLMDFSRFTTFDLSEIQLAKGFSSISYGPNTLGGAINLVTRRPVSAFEGDARVGLSDGGGRITALNIGTNQGLWYLQAGGSYTSLDSVRMSSNFSPNSREDGGSRDNSDSIDRKLSMKVGFTPNDTDEYAVGISRQRADKGNPISTDLSSTVRYWRWPQWDKDSYFFSSHTALGSKSYLKFRAYYDSYKNSIASYTDGTYTTLNVNASGFSPYGRSYYNDFTHGLMLELGSTALTNHSLKAVLQTKTDVHREGNDPSIDTANWLNYQDEYRTAGVEDTITLSDKADLSLGLGWDQLKPVSSGPTWSLPDAKSFWHGQAGFFYKLTPKAQLYATVAQKDHFPTLKDRYSQRFSTYIENPDLKPERSLNYEVGTKLQPTDWLQLEAALFRSDIRDLIQEVKNVQGTKSQMQNVGEVRHTGVELSVGLKPNQYVQGGLSYTYLDRENLSNETKLTSTPYNRISGYVRVNPTTKVYALISVQAQDSVWDSNTSRIGGYTTANLTLGWQITQQLLLDGGFTNLLDRDYQMTLGYPMPGRTWFTNARYKF